MLQRAAEALIDTRKPAENDRLDALRRWLQSNASVDSSTVVPASADASFRRYFRVRSENGSFIVMDAPPAREDSRSFIRVAGYLEAMMLNAPRVLEADLQQGFLLLTDLGSTDYLTELNAQPHSAERLYGDALAALAAMQSRGAAYQGRLPAYDAELLSFELSLFHDWLCETHLELHFEPDEEKAWQELCDLLVGNALDQPQVFVHRDYHSRNLMVTGRDNPGILDFQDAVEGPFTYDLVSLLKDCYIKWPQEQTDAWMQRFYGRLDRSVRDLVDERQFLRYFDLMGVQRQLKAAGIFARLNHRDGKDGYLKDIPRTLSYILDVAPRHGQLAFLDSWIRQRCLPALDHST